MKVEIDGITYDVLIERKAIKNTYIRVKEDLNIYITTSYLTPDFYIKDLIKKNINEISRMIESAANRLDKSTKFFYLGKEYDVVYKKGIKKAYIEENSIVTPTKRGLDTFLKNQASLIFSERLNRVYYSMNNKDIPYPTLAIKKMKRKWGYNRKKDKLVALNTELIKHELDDIDYVIVHELCHFLYFDHSKNFWNAVKTYKPNYKENKKHLKED